MLPILETENEMAINSASNNVFRYIHFTAARLTNDIKDRIRREVAERENSGGTDDVQRTSRQPTRADLISALRNLKSLDLALETDIRKSGLNESPLAMLNRHGLSKLTDATKLALSNLGIDPSTTDHSRLVSTLGTYIAEMDDEGPAYIPGNQQANSGYIRAVGTANLHVLKQQIKRYEAGEIAHIENVIAGEKKIRRHNNLTKIEEFSSLSSEKTTDTETEFETTERFELNKQSSRTFQKDTELGLELTVSGKYGPTLSFESNLNAGQTTSTTNATQQSTGFAKETIERSKERVIESITVRQEQTLIREITETNKHILSNESPDHRFAIYQYVDKIYESQVFDYGKRLMFDFMVPEPASFLWYLKSKTSIELDIPKPISLADREILSPSDITAQNYDRLGAIYGVSNLPAPPSLVVTKRLKLMQGTGSASDDGKFKTGLSGELDIPDQYGPKLVRSTLLATSDENFSFAISVGGKILHYKKADFIETSVSGGHKRYSLVEQFGTDIELAILPNSLSTGQKLHVDIYGYESANYSIHMEVQFRALYNSEELDYGVLAAWRKDVYGQLLEAYQNALVQYEQELAFQTAQAEAQEREIVDFGAPPAVTAKIINTELKKHCIAIIQGEHAGALVTPHSGQPPQFDLVEARENGDKIRFLEHAFEWDQVQFVFYPYFWARPQDDLSGWADRMLEKNPDYTMEEFLRAGYARVVVPVREGFEEAVSYFAINREVFNGLGAPDIGDPLYVSIIDELKERAGAGKDEIPIGDPWETRLPTAAVIVRLSSSLPKWKLNPGTDWDWVPDDE